MLRKRLEEMNWNKVVGFQTRNPMHKSHKELTIKAAKKTGANILIQPVVGMTKEGDVQYFIRVKCYIEMIKTYNEKVMLNLIPLAMRMAGPREAMLHAIIRVKNFI